jgi:tRNA threonylcarbamoyladenosine biosynthesis protein TsaE
VTSRTRSPEETEHVGTALAGLLEPGDVVLLLGGLGAGKTTFVRGIAGGLGIGDEVTSPTFTLCQIYAGRLSLMHADLWRLERLQEVLDLALDEGLEDGGVLVAEWGEGAADVYGDEALFVTIEETGLGDGDGDGEGAGAGAGAGASGRAITAEPRGPRWERRADDLERVFS